MEDYKIISDEFTAKYKNKQPNWGFNGLGYVVYKRTYSRLIEGEDRTEEWPETIQRCINGAQKIGAEYTKEEAERLFDLVFNLKCNFAGRMLWQLGTTTVDRFGANSLLNCWGVRISEINAFCFLFENLMLGGGVGYSVRKEDIHELPRVKTNVNIQVKNTKDADHIVPDTREGWVNLLRKVLESYFENGKSFSYSTILIRGAGELIKGFGGTSSGPKILEDGIQSIISVIKAREGKKLRSIDCLDICNIIGSIVVAGNVRRSAEIALGDPDDFLFLRAKRWDLGNVPNWRAMSNNTIYADDYDHIMESVWDGYAGNGEPYGFFNLPLTQSKGRIKDGGKKKDVEACVTNPCCFSVDSEVFVKTKNGIKEIKTITDQDKVWISNAFVEEYVSTSAYFKAGKAEVYRVKFSSGDVFDVTLNHKFATYGGYGKILDLVPLALLKEGDQVLMDEGEFCTIKSIERQGITEVGCINTESGFFVTKSGLISGNSEISLENYECCNLSELYLNNIDTKEELAECSKLLYKAQKAICALPFIHEETNKVVHKNFRIGQGVTGICQSLDKMDWLDWAYLELKKFDKEWSKERGWPTSIKLTTVKPSGTLSLLAGSTPGVHPAFSKYYIRRVRMSSGDKLIKTCKDLGYKTEFARNFDGSTNHDTSIVEFPCYAGEGVLEAKNMSAIKQLDLVKRLQNEWSDNAVSCTVYYKKEELDEIKDWLRKNYKNNIKSVSFLLHSDHGFDQAPYEEIDEKTYMKLVSKTKPIETIAISGGEMIEGVECEGGACPVR